jgi:hypothetical protein
LVKSPYPTVTGQQGFTLYGTAATPYNNITIEGYGATITTDNLHNNRNWFGLDYVNHLTIKGFTFAANPTGLSAGSEPSAFFLARVTDALLKDISLTGNWGGSTRNPAFVAGNWLTDVVFDRINLPKMSLCFDLAFLRRVTFRDVKAVGANDSGGTSGGSRGGCINIEYDATFVASYPTAVTFSTTDHVTNHGEKITNTLINGSQFNNNTNTAVKTIGPNVSNIVVGSNTLVGANQTTGYDSTTLTLLGQGTKERK